jgi:hypothetical protein
MPTVPDEDALRRPLRSCAIGAVILFVFLIAWQYLVPGEHSNDDVAWAFILAASVCLSYGIGLAVSATRRLWRSTHRGLSVLPGSFLVGVVIAFLAAGRAVGAHALIDLGAVLLALLVSSALSAHLIRGAKEAAPAPIPPTRFNTDEPHAYASDIPGKRKAG